MHRPITLFKSTSLIILASLSLSAGAAFGQDTADSTSSSPDESTPGWAVEPGGAGDRSWFVYQLAPGQSLRDTIAIENPLEEPITLDLYGADAFNTEDSAAFAVDEAGVKPDDVGSWLTIGRSQYTVEPGRRVEIPFEISIPLDASPGDHAGAVVGANVEAEEVVDAEGATLSLKRRIGARVYVRVEGPLDPALEISELSISGDAAAFPVPGGEVTVDYEVRNVGNVRLTPAALLEVDGLLGHGVHAFPAEQLPELLPGSHVRVSVTHDGGVWPLDRVRARLTVRANDVTVERTTSDWVVSPGLVIAIALVVILESLRRTRRRWRAGAEAGPANERADQKELIGT